MTSLFGIPGLTIGGVGIWAIIFGIMGRVAIRWIMGMPDRKRADIAGDQSQEAAIAAQWARFQGEIDRLLKRVDQLQDRVEHLEKELDESREREVSAVSELSKLRAVVAGQGQNRQEAAVIASAERIVERKRVVG